MCLSMGFMVFDTFDELGSTWDYYLCDYIQVFGVIMQLFMWIIECPITYGTLDYSRVYFFFQPYEDFVWVEFRLLLIIPL